MAVRKNAVCVRGFVYDDSGILATDKDKKGISRLWGWQCRGEEQRAANGNRAQARRGRKGETARRLAVTPATG